MPVSIKKDKKSLKKKTNAVINKSGAQQRRFIVLHDDDSRKQYNLQLQFNKTIKSWIIPKTPTVDAKVKRLAIHGKEYDVLYHPKDKKERAAIWDKGILITVDEAGNKITDRQTTAWFKKGELKFILKGKKLKGGFALVRLKDDEKNWLLIKHKDRFAL